MPQRIDDVMPPHPVTLPGTASVYEAACVMRDQAIGDGIVRENHPVCGIVTDRDIGVRTVAEAREPTATTLAHLCSHTLTTVAPTESIEQAGQRMRENAMRRLPVVEDGQAVGMVSLGEISAAPPKT